MKTLLLTLALWAAMPAAHGASLLLLSQSGGDYDYAVGVPAGTFAMSAGQAIELTGLSAVTGDSLAPFPNPLPAGYSSAIGFPFAATFTANSATFTLPSGSFSITSPDAFLIATFRVTSTSTTTGSVNYLDSE